MNKVASLKEPIAVLAPSPGESITEVQISKWLVADGATVKRDDDLVEFESEKASLVVQAESSGLLKHQAADGQTVAVGSVVALLTPTDESVEQQPKAATAKAETPAKAETQQDSTSVSSQALASPAAAKMLREASDVPASLQATGKGGRLTKADVANVLASSSSAAPTVFNAPADVAAAAPATAPSVAPAAPTADSGAVGSVTREKMSPLRKKIAQRLVAAKSQTAMLTTFNEVDLLALNRLRKEYKELFKEKYGVGLGYMSLFSKASILALQEYEQLNSQIEGEEILRFTDVDLGIAVSAPKGLVVPVIKRANHLSLAQIEQKILELAKKARDNQLTMAEMTGGTFTITNGGVFGSMLSTPILNHPQCAILGMHSIIERPVVHKGEIVVRPMMYLALSYDHRIVDGKEAVSFLVRIKQLLEDPARMLLGI